MVISVYILLLLIYFCNSILNKNNFRIIKLEDLKVKYFDAFPEPKPQTVFIYENKFKKIFNSSIIFQFYIGIPLEDKEILLYNSLDEIEKKDGQYINYLKRFGLNVSDCFQIFSNETFYKDNSFYYLLLNNKRGYTLYSYKIFVINSLSYYPLENDTLIDFINDYFRSDITIHYVIQKENSTFLHFQSKGINNKNKAYFFQVKNEKGETFIDSYFNAMSEYIQIEPIVKYYIQITLLKIDETENIEKREVMLNFQKYKNNFLLDTKNRTEVKIYSGQMITFFLKITDLEIGRKTYFSITFLDLSGTFESTVYYNFYDSDNFEELVNYFPSEENKFDNYLGTSSYSNKVEMTIVRNESSPQGILFGVFIKRRDKDNEIIPFGISAEIKIEEKPKPTDHKTDEIPSESSESKSNTGVIIFAIILVVVVIVGCVIFAKNPDGCPCPEIEPD